MAECMKCSVCEDQDHHWIEDVSDAGNPVLACMHCDATKDIGGMRDRIASVAMDDSAAADNLAVALCAYYEMHPDRPNDDPETERGWGEWVEAAASAALYRIAVAASGADR